MLGLILITSSMDEESSILGTKKGNSKGKPTGKKATGKENYNGENSTIANARAYIAQGIEVIILL